MTRKRTKKLTELRDLQAKVDALRKELRVSPPGKVTFMAGDCSAGDAVILVEADGYGGATTSVVEGNFPVDYITKFDKFFSTEKKAESAASKMAWKGSGGCES